MGTFVYLIFLGLLCVIAFGTVDWIIVLKFSLVVILVGAVLKYFSAKEQKAKKLREDIERQNEQQIRDQQEEEKRAELKLQRLAEEAQLLRLLELYGGSDRVERAQLTLDSDEMSWKRIGICRLRTDFLERFLIVTFATNSISEYSDVLLRKKKQNVYTDDYGRKLTGKWTNELEYFIENVFREELINKCGRIRGYPIMESEYFKGRVLIVNDANIEYWSNYIDELMEDFEDRAEAEYDSDLSGHEYENFVAELIETTGWSVVVTKGSGDHGADIIAELESVRIAIQCKKYESPVGNKSVQEAFSGAKFYDCYFGCVVSNADFTPAARQAATKLQVRLLHHDEVSNYFTSLKTACEENVQNTE